VSAFQNDCFNLGCLLTLARTLGNTMIDIYVGTGAQTKQFHIHKALLCAKIPYFDKMFNSGFKEEIQNKAHLPEDDPESFDILQEWIYTGTLPKYRITKEQGKGTVANFSSKRLYALVDKLCLDSLKDQIATDILAASETGNILPSLADIGDMIDHLPETSAFRRYFVLALVFIMHGLPKKDQILSLWPTRGLSDLLEGHPKVSLAYVKAVRKLPLGRVAEDPRTMSRCTFHGHRDGEACPVKKRNQD